MSTQQEIVDQLVQDILLYKTILTTAYQNLKKAKAELADWGYTWTPETGVQKLPEGETES